MQEGKVPENLPLKKDRDVKCALSLAEERGAVLPEPLCVTETWGIMQGSLGKLARAVSPPRFEAVPGI